MTSGAKLSSIVLAGVRNRCCQTVCPVKWVTCYAGFLDEGLRSPRYSTCPAEKLNARTHLSQASEKRGITVKDTQSDQRCSLSTELDVLEALARRSLAFDAAGLIDDGVFQTIFSVS